MSNEKLDTINKLIKPEDISKSDDAVVQQLSENLQDITPEEIDTMCEEMSEVNSDSLDESGKWKEIGGIMYNKERKIIIRKGKTFNFSTYQNNENFIGEVVNLTDKSELEKLSFVLKEIGEDGHANIIDSVFISHFDYINQI